MRPALDRAGASLLAALALFIPCTARASADGGWVQLAPSTPGIPPFVGAAVAMDTRRGRLIETGGDFRNRGGVPPEETWSRSVRDTTEWTSLGPAPAATTPNGYEYAAAVYDSLADCVYLFGGARFDRSVNRYTFFSRELWRLQLGQATSSWQRVDVAGTGPVGRKGHVLAFDAVRRRLVLFGGRDSSNVALADLWTLDVDTPSAWAQVTGPAPRAREFAAGGMNAAHDRLIVVGGVSNGGTAIADAWAFDFTVGGWSNFGATGGPQGAVTGAVDAARDRMLVLAPAADSLACWELPLGFATQWRRLTPAGFTPRARLTRFAAAFDPVSDCLAYANGDYDLTAKAPGLVILHALHFSPLPVVHLAATCTPRYERGITFLDFVTSADRALYGPLQLAQVLPGSAPIVASQLPEPDGHMLFGTNLPEAGTHYDFRLAWFDGETVRSIPVPLDTPPAPVRLDVSIDRFRAVGQWLEVVWNVPGDSATWLSPIVAEHRIGSGPWISDFARYPVAGKTSIMPRNDTSGDTVSVRLRWGPTRTEYASEPATLVTPIQPTLVAASGNRAAAVAEFRVPKGTPFTATLHDLAGPVGPAVAADAEGLLHLENTTGEPRDRSGTYVLSWDVGGTPRFTLRFDLLISDEDVDLLHLATVDSSGVSFAWSDPDSEWSVPLVLERAAGAAAWDSIGVLPPGLPAEDRTIVDDEVLPATAYRYRLRWPQQGLSLVHSLEVAVTTPGTTPGPPPPAALAFGAALANPMRDVVALPVTTPAGEAAVLELYDATGRRARRLALAPAWNGTVSLVGLRSGMYVARLATASAAVTRKVVLL
jgi:hypothetical protein